MSRSNELSSKRSTEPSAEQAILLRWVRKILEKFLEDPGICLLVRRKSVRETKTITQILDELLSDEEIQRKYPDMIQYHNAYKEALYRLRYELLTPEEIIELAKIVNKQRASKIVESRGDISWGKKENQKILRNILREEAAFIYTPDWEKIARKFFEITGLEVKPERIRGAFIAAREKSGKELKTPRRRDSGIASAKATGKIVWDERLNKILKEIVDDSEMRRRSLNLKYIIGRFAEITETVVSVSSVEYAIKKYQLLPELEEGVGE